MITALERADRSSAIPLILAGIAFFGWAMFVYRTGWSAPAIADRLRRRRLEPERSGFMYWMTCVVFALAGAAGVVTGLRLLL
ncbi:MAG: hypothetical protein ACRDYW_00175 [Acidimicrobiales bacterium]